MYDFLKSQKIEFEYIRENHIFPIEFDARYNAMIQMNKIRESYFKEDEEFLVALKNSSVIPNNFNIEITVDKIFNDFIMVYKLYDNHSDVTFHNVIEYIFLNEKAVKEILKKRYLDMLEIDK